MLGKSLGSRIRELRLQKKLTQIDLAEGLVTPSMISQIESDRARPSYRVLFALADRLGVQLEHLLKDVDLDLEHTSKHKLAMALVRAGEFKSAIPLFEELLETPNQPVPKVEIQVELGTCYLELGEWNQAISLFERVLDFSLLQKDHTLTATTFLFLGKAYQRKKEFPIAMFHTQRALDEISRIEEADPVQRGRIISQMAAIYQAMGKAEEAAKYYEQSLGVYDSFESLEEKGRMYLSLARTYRQRGDFAKVEEYATKAMTLLHQMKDQESYMEWQRQLLLLRNDKTNWQGTVRQLLSFAGLYERQLDTCQAGTIYADIAHIYLQNGEFEQANAYAEKANMMLPQFHEAMGQVQRVLATVYFTRGEQEKGKQYMESAISLFERLGRLSEMEEVTLNMCKLLSEQGQHKEAFFRVEKLHDFMMKKLSERGVVL